MLSDKALGEVPTRGLSEGPTRVGGRVLGRTVLTVGLAVVLFAVGAVLVTRQAEPERSAPAVVGAVRSSSLSPAGSGLPVEALQQRLRDVPEDWRSWAVLSLAYVQQARVTADPTYYDRAEGAVQRSLELRPTSNFEASIAQGALALGRHRFDEALEWGRRARELNPYAGNAYGVIGDAQLELGRYRAAFGTFQEMVDLRPDVASYSRGSYVRELLGDIAGAEQVMELAMGASSSPEDRAFAAYHLGELAWDSGRPRTAARWYRQSIALAPGYVPPLAGLAEVAWADGRLETAIRLYRRVVDRNPLPEYAAALGDLYAAAGQPEMARQQFDLVGAEERLFRAAGVNVDLEIALFDADHGRPRAALEYARQEWRRRESIHVADALGWALYRNGRYRAASRFSTLALELGTRNALFHFHRGMIELALGDRAEGLNELRLAVDINPHFSVQHSTTATRVIERLGGTP